MSPEVFHKVVVPLLLIDETALLCITTISNDVDNHYDHLLNLQGSNGAPLLRQYKYSFVCPSCEAQGITVECKHMEHRIPKWQSMRKHKMVQAIMSSRKGDMERETLGLDSGDNESCVFRKDRVDAWFNYPRFRDTSDAAVRFVYVAIDPNSGTEDSRVAAGSDVCLFCLVRAGLGLTRVA